MIEIDGSRGEGGGQVLRTSLALAMCTGKAFRITKIRSRRGRPGLMRQHLTATLAAAEVCGARLDGAALHSSALDFTPGPVRPGSYHFDVGSAGSATLVLQTVLPALLTAAESSRLTLEGGTHNPHAPPFDFLARVYLPLVERLGPRITATLERPGFYPAGGGRMTVDVTPSARLAGFALHERGKVLRRRATALIAALPRHVAERELRQVARKAEWDADWLHVEEVADPAGPGNAVMLEVVSEQVTELFTGFGEVRVPAEKVAAGAVREMRRYLKADVPVGEHLADQLLLPLALAGQGSFTTLPLTRHATTQIDLVQRFLDVAFHTAADDKGRVTVRIES